METVTIQEIPQKLISDYGIEFLDDSIHIHKPAFVNIDKNDRFKIRETDGAFELYNSKVTVVIWKSIIHLHISVH